MNGWIKIHRQLVESEVWLSEPFSRSQAWVDLICLANHKEGFIRTKKGTRVKVERGQVGYSQEALAKRWQWSRGKVRRYLSELEKTDRQIVQGKSPVISLISIVNYEKYQDDSTGNGTWNGTRNGHGTDTNKNDKKNKEEEIYKEILEEKFKKEVFDFIGKQFENRNPISPDTAKAFFVYWSEKDTRGKMRWQKEKTWELKKRIYKWIDNELKFNNNGKK